MFRIAFTDVFWLICVSFFDRRGRELLIQHFKRSGGGEGVFEELQYETVPSLCDDELSKLTEHFAWLVARADKRC